VSDAASQKDATGMDATPEIIIPNDLAGCRALIEQLVSTVTSQTNAIDVLRREKQELEAAYAELVQRAFRHRSERYLNDPNQLLLDLGGTADAADVVEGLTQAVQEAGLPVKAHTRRRHARKPRSEALPEHLPRYEVEARVPEQTRHCPQHGERMLIGYDRVEKLEFERPKLRVRVTKYPKYACSGHADCGIASPERPTGLVEGDRYDTSVAAEIITAKYGFHLPVYRQQDLFAGSGWTPDRSTLLNLLVASASFFRPLAEHIKQVVLADDVLGTDETRVTLLVPPTIPDVDVNDPKSRRTHEVLSEAAAAGRRSVSARMWAYRGVNTRLVVFDFTVSRHRDGPDLMLAGYTGTLVADCYSGYQGITLRSNGRIRRAACNAHARRKVFDARDAYPLESSVVLAKFQQLYDIEDRVRTASIDERLALRQRESVAIWRSLGEWLESKPATDVLPKSKLGEALGYLRNHWEPLQTYLNDGRVPMDNNEVEQLMKQVAIGRKNWLFIGSVEAGHRAADFLTLVSSAVRNDLDVWAYLKDVLDHLLAGDTDYAALRPDVWRQAHPEAIREYRVTERRDRADRKQLRRATRRRLLSKSRR
jgi:transposase